MKNDHTRRAPHGTGFILGTIAGLVFWASVYIAARVLVSL